MEKLIYNRKVVTKKMTIAPSPNGKATDSDSVIFKVRILVALRQRYPVKGISWGILFLNFICTFQADMI